MHRILLLCALLALAVVPLAHGTSPSLVISQVYVGGGNIGAPYTNDFVELFNRGSSSVDLTGWSLQNAPAPSPNWQVTPLAGPVPPGGYFLVGLASGGTAGSALPAADATGTPNLATSGGKVALVAGTTALTCGASAGSCVAVDFVGWGTAADYEGPAATPALTATLAAVRATNAVTVTAFSSASSSA